MKKLLVLLFIIIQIGACHNDNLTVNDYSGVWFGVDPFGRYFEFDNGNYFEVLPTGGDAFGMLIGGNSGTYKEIEPGLIEITGFYQTPSQWKLIQTEPRFIIKHTVSSTQFARIQQ